MYTIEFTEQASYDPPINDIVEVFIRSNGHIIYRAETVGKLAVYVQFQDATTRSKDIQDAWSALKSAEYAKNVLLILNDEGMKVPSPSPLCDNVKLACTTAYRPVCGVNRKTYSNACNAARDCVEVAREGPC